MASSELDIALAHLDLAQTLVIEAMDGATEYSADNLHQLIALSASMAIVHATMTTELADAIFETNAITNE